VTSATAVKQRSAVRAPYKLADGTRVPSVTTILGVVAKPALIKWANNLGLQGIDSTKYVDSLAAIGTLAHSMILADLRGENPADCGEGLDKATIDLAENCFLSYLSWKTGKTIVPLIVEEPMVSELCRFGGRFDFYGDVDGVRVLIDFKTGKGIWPEHFYQLAAYSRLIVESGSPEPEYGMILNIPRAETESFDTKKRADLTREWEFFSHALTLYRLKQDIEGR
jgi:hypothetical protein